METVWCEAETTGILAGNMGSGETMEIFRRLISWFRAVLVLYVET